CFSPFTGCRPPNAGTNPKRMREVFGLVEYSLCTPRLLYSISVWLDLHLSLVGTAPTDPVSTTGDTKAGTFIGADRYGNKYYENMAEELPRKLDTTWLLGYVSRVEANTRLSSPNTMG